MPLYPDVTPSKLKAENASVFDPLWLRGLRGVAHVVGADDPTTSIMGSAMPTPLMAISKRAPQAAIDALLDLLDQPLAQEGAGQVGKATGYRIPAPSQIKPPKGFTLKTSPTAAREPGLAARQTKQAEAFKPFQRVEAPVESVRAIEELADIRPTTPARTTVPSVSGRVAIQRGKPSPISEDTVRAIRELRESGKSLNEVYAAFPKIKKEAVGRIVRGESFNWVK